MYRLVEGLEREQADRDLNGGVGGLLPHMVREELLQGSDGLGPQPLALGAEPVFEGRLLDAEAFQQIAAIEAHGFLERLGRSVRDAGARSARRPRPPGTGRDRSDRPPTRMASSFALAEHLAQIE